MEPTLLLLDEPSTGMNREEKENLARFLLRIKHELGMTMLWVEHDMELVGDLADSVTVLDFGQRIAAGPPGAVLRDPRVIEADRKSTRLNSSHVSLSRMPSSA